MPANPTSAPAQAVLDAVTSAASIAEQQKKAAQAKKDAAAANLDAAKAEASRIELLKASLPAPPDATKYQAEKPTASNLNASIARITFNQVKELSDDISKAIQAAVPVTQGSKKEVTLIAESNKVRLLLAVEQATREGMCSVLARLAKLTADLRTRIDRQATLAAPAVAPLPSIASGGLLLISSIVENVMAYAASLRTQWGFATTSSTSSAETLLVSLIYSKLSRVRVVDPDAILALLGQESELAVNLLSTRNAINAARIAISDAALWSAKKRSSVHIEQGNDTAQNTAQLDAAQSADEVDRLASLTGSCMDEADKFLTALFIIDAQGGTIFDSAQRGEILRKSLGAIESVYTLLVKIVSSDADTVASDRLFSGLKLYVGTTTTAQWKLIDCRGVIRGTGAHMVTTKPHQIQLTTDKI